MNTFHTPNIMTIDDFPFSIHTGAIKPKWTDEARKKRFDIVARVVDRLHLALQCKECGHINKTRLYTLMSATPLCQNCLEQAWKDDAIAADLMFLRRDPSNRHYGHYRLPCGHEIRRQFALIKRVAAGTTGLRCETCHAVSEAAEAEAQGWELLGPDLKGDPNYREFRHITCGHEQRIARSNIQTQRFSCGGCSLGWPAAPSFIYVMAFVTATGRELVKVGFSRNPKSRLHHQLKVDPEMPCTILRVVAVPTGQKAIILEKSLHKRLKRDHSDKVVNPSSFRNQIRVVSEIYDGSLAPVILEHLDRIEVEIAGSAA
ncbi:GIY-YIG nuclease family protein [Marivita sp. S0852]|uniref:GIY-YIG nuclease family protein n=1 Tax=Marivita sp. S0852 TaxID=3373893 RepID=UPI0039822A9A